MALRGLAATRAAVGLCRIAASASSSWLSAAAGWRRERELPFELVAERGMVVGGHRGMGMNAVGAPPGAPVGAARERENTLLSFGRAAVAFVEFDVQVTKDGSPIIFHDDFILTQGIGAVYERRVTDLLLEDFLSYGTQKESRKVLFLTEGGTSKHHDSRRNSLDDAIRVCLEHDQHGIVSEVRGVLKNLSAVVRAQESNLALLTYGQLNNMSEAVYIQYLMGVHGVIVDRVEVISNAVAGFGKPDLGQSGAGVDGVKHQAFSQQQLGFLLRLIHELIEQRH